MASFLQREVPKVLSVATTFRSSEHSTPIQSHVCHSTPDPDLPASTATTNCDVDYFEDEALKDFWSEFEFSGLAMNQRGVHEINQKAEDDQMGRPVSGSRKRHKGLLGQPFQGSHDFHFTPRYTPGGSIPPGVITHCGHQKADMETIQEP